MKIFQFLIFTAIVGIIGLAIIVIHIIFSQSPSRREKQKYQPYESGMLPFHDAKMRFPVKFYVFAMVFLIFDIEVVLLLPYVPIARDIGIFGFVEIIVFFSVLFLVYIYLIVKGVLKAL